MKADSYRIAAKTLKKIGTDAYEIGTTFGALGLSTLTPFVPREMQQKIAEKTGVSSSTQTVVSGLIELYLATKLGILTDYLPHQTLEALFVYSFAEGVLRGTVGFFSVSGSRTKDDGFGSIPVEVSYWIGKTACKGIKSIGSAAKNYLTNAYEEAKREAELEK